MEDVQPASHLEDRGREVEGNPHLSSQTPAAIQVSTGINPTALNHMELQPQVSNASPAMSLPSILNQEFVHSQNVGAAGSGTAVLSSNYGVPRAYSPNTAPASSAFLTAQTAPTASIQPTELVSQELIPCAAQLYSDSTAQDGTSDSSDWLGGTIAAASTSPPLISNNLPVGGITDPSAVISFPAAISFDNRGSVLPDSLNTGDALERYEQVSQKIEALIAKDGKDGEIQLPSNGNPLQLAVSPEKAPPLAVLPPLQHTETPTTGTTTRCQPPLHIPEESIGSHG